MGEFPSKKNQFSKDNQPENPGRKPGLSSKVIIGHTLAQHNNFQEMVDAILEKAKKGDTKAFDSLLDRLEGKATQRIDANISEPILAKLTIVPASKMDDSDK